MLIDHIEVRLEAGPGGRGSVAFQKVRLNRGPTGGDGGNGGNIYFEGVSDINALGSMSANKVIRAAKGGDGRGQFIDGMRGEDKIVKVPTGTLIINKETGFTKEINAVGERVLAAGGGKGGRGNFKFRSSTNTTPMEHEEGTVGDVSRTSAWSDSQMLANRVCSMNSLLPKAKSPIMHLLHSRRTSAIITARLLPIFLV
jgi:GTP-binding protein